MRKKTVSRAVDATASDDRIDARPKAHIRAANLREILSAAEQVFAKHGFQGATIAEVARVSGITKPSVHYYVGTKEKLYRMLLQDVDTQWRQEMDDWILPQFSPAEAFTGYIRAKMAHSSDRPFASRVFANELLHGAPYLKRYLGVTLRQHVERKAQVVRDWIARGLMEPIDPTHLFFNIWAMTQTYADFESQICAVLAVGALDRTAFATATDTILKLVLDGCGIRPTLSAEVAACNSISPIASSLSPAPEAASGRRRRPTSVVPARR
jgi:TetR/AcrR family transcriptional regulator